MTENSHLSGDKIKLFHKKENKCGKMHIDTMQETRRKSILIYNIVQLIAIM